MADRHARACPLGLTVDEVQERLYDHFTKWMYGQTMGVCDGTQYNHDDKVYESTSCADSPHGMVVYSHDLQRFLDGRPVID